jgi:thymidine phosphorylase
VRIQDIIARKRDGGTLNKAAIGAIGAGLASGAVSDAQAAAFAMAVFLNGLSTEERVALTHAMRDSGDVMHWELPGPVLDKHSTGGIGDNVSLVLAPALAACGAYVPMISGRGLGHTGGTLDKFEAIPGYQVQPALEVFQATVRDVGCAIIGQTDRLAPADRRLYAIRDETATVESLDLITASILSKKLAAGLDALVLDVKCGSGAFMGTIEEAQELAAALVLVANEAGCRTGALLTDMNEPLASAAGNAVEMANACELLTGYSVDSRLWDVTLALGGVVLSLGGLAKDVAAGAAMIGDVLSSGAAAERMGRMVAALGGPVDFMESWSDHLGAAPVVRTVCADRNGFLTAMDGRAIGAAVIGLGGGRRIASDQIDHRVGFDRITGLGAAVATDEPLVRVHAASEAGADAAAARFLAACSIGDAPPADDVDPVLERILP